MYDKTLYSFDGCSLMVDTENSILCMTADSSEYNEEVFLSFMDYLTSFWVYVKDNNLKYYMLIDVRGASVAVMPLEFYRKLINVLNSLNDILNVHLHSICILCPKKSIIKNVLNILFKLYTPSRPIKMVDSEESATVFFQCNTIK